MVTSADIEDIISKLSSDKAKPREEGVKLLHTWLESADFCQYISLKTAELKPNQIPHSQTWPFLLKLLTECIALEISACKKRPPKLLFAKVLRIFIQKAEDAYSGKMLFLLPVIKSLFNHILDIFKDAPIQAFQSEYETVLRLLLGINEYRFHMRKKVYCSLLLLHMAKVESSLRGVNNIQHSDLSRCITTLHSLLENPPGDFPANIREDVVQGIIGISPHISKDKGKFSRKIIECINTYLLKDGPNLDHEAMEIHSAVQDSVFRCWLTLNDLAVKDAVIFYARLQLKLIRNPADGIDIVEQILDVVCKELDQSITTSIWMDGKLGKLTSSRCGLMELASSVLYQACVNTTKAPSQGKRPRRENAAVRLRQGLMKGKWLWSCAFCFLIRNYHSRICQDLMVYWFEGICESFNRILNEGNSEHTYDGFVWALRSLQELSSIHLVPVLGVRTSQSSPLMTNELRTRWLTIWSSLIHALPTFSNENSVADVALSLLGNIISQDLINIPTVPQDFWDLRLFKHLPSMSALYFIMCYFTKKGSQGNIREILQLRKNLLREALALLNWKESYVLNECVINLLPSTMFSLCFGFAPFPQCSRSFLIFNSYVDFSEVLQDRVKADKDGEEFFYESFECSVEVLAEIEQGSCVEAIPSKSQYVVRLPRQLCDPLQSEMEDFFLAGSVDNVIDKLVLSDIFFVCALLCNCIYGSMSTRLRDGNSAFLIKLIQHVIKLLQRAVYIIEEYQNDIQSHGFLGSNHFLEGTGSILVSIRGFVQCPLLSLLRNQDFVVDGHSRDIILVSEKFLKSLAKLFEEYSKGTLSVQSEILDNKTGSDDMEFDV